MRYVTFIIFFFLPTSTKHAEKHYWPTYPTENLHLKGH